MMNQRIGLFLTLCKWPVALAFALFTPAAAVLLLQEIALSTQGMAYFWPLVGGGLAYLLVWYLWIRNTSVSFLSTLEHEITHCIFAWLTFNRVTGLRATLREGGHMTYQGTGNWLLTIAPYFFPTVTVVLLLVMPFVQALGSVAMHAIIGVSMAYHGTSTWTETHHAQTDLQEAGFVFSFLFLPTANLLSFSLVFASLRAGLSGMGQSLHSLLNSPWSPWQLLG